MTKRDDFMILREQGMSYAQIARLYGCSRQNVENVCKQRYRKNPGNKHHSLVSIELRNWMIKNHLTISALYRRMYGTSSTALSLDTFRKKLIGISPLQLDDINQLLDTTGFTYEQLFRNTAQLTLPFAATEAKDERKTGRSLTCQNYCDGRQDEDMANPETALQNKIIVALCERGCYAVNHTVGQFYTKYGTMVSIGVPGEADIWGHRPDGKAFYLEVKMPGKAPRQEQLAFIAAMRTTGAIAGWCTTVEEAVKIVYEL